MPAIGGHILPLPLSNSLVVLPHLARLFFG
jgi:hypothetical protein